MGLARYHAKRRFDRMPEPSGARPTRRDAARSRQPGEKRLAVHTEDYPVEYASFEGDIPEPEYGAGHVDIWDRGRWIPAVAPVPAYRRGHLKFELKGRKLRGLWALIRMGNAQTRKRDLWLLMKRKDPPRDAARSA